jgi:diaminohydroxyphosphoribosylaminopyrimidine deaminase/5-amino-6-(5-phosphoribosylamino)uracil reductase
MAGGAEALQAAGVQCQHLAEYQAEAEAANAVWLKAMGSQRPFVALKAAMSLDGRIALPSGESRWITGEPARAQAHKLRAEYGAVLVGRRTAQVDNPLLTARIADVVNQPTRVVIDLENKLDPSLRVFDGSAPTLHVVREPRTDRQIAAPFNASELDLVALMTVLFEKGITALLVEGGAVTLASFLQAGLGDRIHLFVAPKMLGAGPSWLSDFAVSTLAGAPQWEFRDVRHHGTDLELILEPPQAS